ncbi:MAG TPA: MXAN_5187 family protein [Polyangiales bacterium]|nr:MXAN_5187 family protein [Polyangiales bacterium]
MLLSRFWYLFLSVAAAAALGAALLGQAVINARSDEALGDALARDRAMVDVMLRLEARSRLDRIAFITVDAKLGGLLRQAQGLSDEKRLRELSGAVKETLRSQVSRMVEAGREGGAGENAKDLEPDIAFALDSDGRIIAQLGPLEQNPPGASLATFPLVKRALQGYLRDDVWVYDRRVYRMAARPVMNGSEYAGAIVHGYRLEKGLSDKLAKNLGGATFTFFFESQLLGTSIPSGVEGAPQAAELSAAVTKAQREPKFASRQASEPVTLQSKGHAVIAPVMGTAASAGVGYAIARPRKLMTSPGQLFEQASQDEVKALPMPQLAGAALVLALIGMFFVYLERDRHMKALVKKLGEIAGGQRERLIVTEWRGKYRTLADRINQAIDKEVEKAGSNAPSARKKANLDEILGPTPESTGTPFFGFASGDEPASAPEKPLPPAPAASPTAASRSAAIEPPARPRPPAHAPAPSPPAAAARPAPPPPATKVAPVAPAAPPPASVAGNAFDEDAHWHEIYDQYVATRRQCGESIDNLSFDKFSITLRKTRDQVVEKHNAKSVRFAVHVKEGKAALKAQPVKR